MCNFINECQKSRNYIKQLVQRRRRKGMTQKYVSDKVLNINIFAIPLFLRALRVKQLVIIITLYQSAQATHTASDAGLPASIYYYLYYTE